MWAVVVSTLATKQIPRDVGAPGCPRPEMRRSADLRPYSYCAPKVINYVQTHGTKVTRDFPALDVGGEAGQDGLFGFRGGLAEGQDGAARMCEHLVDGAVAGESLEEVVLAGA